MSVPSGARDSVPPRTLLHGAELVTGDGETHWERATVLVEGDRIVDVTTAGPPAEFDGMTIDLSGCILMPGLINHHAHGITAGPLFASAAPPLPVERARQNLDQHLASGVTTILNLDGFALPEEVESVARGHPCRVRTATVHLPGHLRAAEAVDGSGLMPRHRRFTVDEAVAAGAVAIGEVGSGHTLGGGGQEYMYLPAAVREATGRDIEPLQARMLKEAVLGRRLERVETPDRAAVQRALAAIGLAEVLSVDRAIQLVQHTVVPAYRRALEAFHEAAAAAVRHGLPLIVHNSAPSRRVVEELCRHERYGVPAGLRLIAGHSNHDTFTVDEAVAFAAALREQGVVVDVSTFDAFGRRRTTESPAHLLAMVRAGVVDTLSTDYGAGWADPILVAVREVVARGFVSLAKAVAMATGNVARALPELAPDGGFVRRGAIADLIWVDAADVARVRGVMVGGRRVR